MAVTNNPNTLNFSEPILSINLVGVRSSYTASISISNISLNASINTYYLNSNIALITSLGTVNVVNSLQGQLNTIPKLTLSGSVVQTNNLNGSATLFNISLSGSSNTSNSIIGKATLNSLISVSGNASINNNNYLNVNIGLVANNFGLVGTCLTGTATVSVPYNRTIVLNLRTKTHYTYVENTLDAYAITGEMYLGSYKDKNVSDIFILGRSDDALNLTVINDELTSRNYEVYFKSSEQANLKNKKVKLTKGLKGTNWQFKFASINQEFTEVRGFDLFVNPLKRHV